MWFKSKAQTKPVEETPKDQGYTEMVFVLGRAFQQYLDGEITKEEVAKKIREDADEFIEAEAV